MDNEYINNNETPPEKSEASTPEIKEVEQPKSAGNFSGFDSVTSPQENNAPATTPPVKKTEQQDGYSGYTVTPGGGYYNNSANTPPVESAPQRAAGGFNPYFPSGSYGSQPGNPRPGAVYNPNYSTAEKQKKPKEKQKHNYGIGALIAVALVASILTSVCFYMFTSGKGGTTIVRRQNVDKGSSSNTTEKVVEITGDIEQLAEIASEKASASVVGVQTTFAVQSFFSGQSTAVGSGSGVVYKSDGYIITNYHVIAEAVEYPDSKITVFLNNNPEDGYEASVINYNISCDLAVLKIDKTGLQAIEFADSDNLKVGQYVVAIGSPASLDFMGSTTFGIISGLNRQISTTDGDMNLIQTDAAINPGNSGGALVNTKGQLIGINSSKLVDESYEGMGFAIPSNMVKDICDNLIAHEGEGAPYTGISISSNYTSGVLEYYGYPVGAVVAGVDMGSPAEAAGIQRGDIITKFGDTKITEYTLYESALSNYYPGDKVKVTFYRAGKTTTVTVTIGSLN